MQKISYTELKPVECKGYVCSLTLEIRWNFESKFKQFLWIEKCENLFGNVHRQKRRYSSWRVHSLIFFLYTMVIKNDRESSFQNLYKVKKASKILKRIQLITSDLYCNFVGCELYLISSKLIMVYIMSKRWQIFSSRKCANEKVYFF